MANTQISRILGSSQMSAMTRAFDWQKNPLGPESGWSDSLMSAVNFMLELPMSTILMVGDGLVTLYNDAYIPTLAERHPNALGMPGNVLWADAWDAVGHQIEAVSKTGASFRFDDVLIPIKRGGILTDAYFTYSFSPIFDGGDGSVAGVMCVAQDVTSMHKAVLDLAANERKLARVAQELSELMSATTDSIVSINRDWEFTYLNAAAIEAYADGRELVGKKLWEEFPEAFYPESPFVVNYERSMYEGKICTFEAYYPNPLDAWIRLSVYPTVDGIVTFSRNITDEKRTTAALLQNEKLAAVGRLAASIAHEINNPLESVTNLLYLARHSEGLAEIQEYLEIAERELRRVSIISNSTLRFHKQATAPQAVSCTDLFAGALSIYQGRFLNSNVTVEKRKRARYAIECFDGEIRQVLNNLIGNAIDAMHPQGGRLIVRSRETHNWKTGEPGIALTVADTGGGMSQQVMRNIFNAFYTTKGIGGTGLGLWVSKEIVERHKGTLTVRSSQSAAHHGTVFVLYLPYQAVRREQ